MEPRHIAYTDTDTQFARIVEVVRLDADGPHVWKARHVPPTPGLQGFGQTDGEAVVNLLNAEVAARGVRP
jgi:hypothetical protein